MDEMIVALDRTLHELGIPYVVIGVIAASVLGRPRMTMASDIVVVLEPDRTNEFLSAMKQSGFAVTAGSISKIASRLRRLLPVKLRYGKHFSVDVRFDSYSLDASAIRRAKKIRLFNVRMPLATPEDLIVYKLARFDGIDQSDIQSILVKHLHTLDASYVRSAAATLEQESGIKSISINLNVVHGWIKKESRMKE